MPISRPANMPPFELCQRVGDLYLRPSRELISQAVPRFFETHGISVIELLHHPDWVRTLEDSGMMLQTILQRAVMQAAEQGGNIRDIKAQLEKLVKEGMAQLRQDAQNELFPDLRKAEQFADLADKSFKHPQGLYVLNGAIARHLRPARTVNERIFLLMTILECSMENRPGWPMLHDAADDILAEILRIPRVLPELVGDVADYGALLQAYGRLFLCHPVHGQYGQGQGLDLMAWHFAAGDLPQSHIAIGELLKAGISAQPPLCDGPPIEELQRFRQLNELVQQCIGPHLRRREIQPELNLRSARLASPEQIRTCVNEYAQPDEKIQSLFAIESCISDAHSRYRIADMIFRTTAAASFQQTFQSPAIPMAEKLRRLADLTRSALASGFDEDQRQKMAATFDNLAYDLAMKSNLFEGIDQCCKNTAQKCITVARLFHGGNIAEGRLARAARKRIMTYIRQPGYLEQYIAYRTQRDGKPPERTQALIDIGLDLKRVGIDPEIALYRVMM